MVTGFVRRGCRGTSFASAKVTVTGLRSLLRFMYLDGTTGTLLTDAVPSPAGWQLAPLPRAISTTELNRLLASCDPSRPLGRRDLAILTMLSRLGLRASEVGTLELGDIDWRAGRARCAARAAGRIGFRCRSMSARRSPTGYGSDARPGCECRQVFIRPRAPHGPLTAGAVSAVVRRAGRRAGVGPVGRAPAAAHHRGRTARRGSAPGRGRPGPAAHAGWAPPPSTPRSTRARCAGWRATMAGGARMSGLQRHVADYLRAPPRRWASSSSATAHLLAAASSTSPTRPAPATVTVELALAWARCRRARRRVLVAQRLGVVRGFAAVPARPSTRPPRCRPPICCRPATRVRPRTSTPAADIAALMRGRAARCPLRCGPRRYETLIGLLAATGHARRRGDGPRPRRRRPRRAAC